MSWSRIVQGAPSAVKEAASKWADEQREYDKGLSEAAAAGHQKQIEAAAGVVGVVCDSLSEHDYVDVSAWGHHDGNPKSNSAGFSVSYGFKAPVES